MRVLVTASRSRLGAAVAEALSGSHEVRTLDLPDAAGAPVPTFAGDPRDRDFAATAVAGCDAVVHVAPVARPGASPLAALDAATRGTYNLLTTFAAASAGGGSSPRFVLLSSLRPFERYPMEWRVTETWAPQPTTEVSDLTPFLAEATVRESSRVLPLKAIALRLGEVVDDADVRGRAPDPRWLHVADAVRAVERALAFEPSAPEPPTGWWVFHIVGAGRRTRFPLAAAGQAPFGYAPERDLAAGAAVIPPREWRPRRLTDRIGGAARKVVIFGAGGPLGAVTARALARDHVLRLADIRPLADIVAAGQPQSPGAPLPELLGEPHEARVVDVTDPEQVLEAARGMDAIINCTVVRPHPVEAFRVNTLGAYNVMRAALELGIRRVVHTGPQLVTLHHPAGYWYDFHLSDDVPMRPGSGLYGLSKFLGQEVCRIFAEEHGLEVPTLLFSSFVNPTNPPPEPLGAFPFSVSWEDAGEAMRLALRAPSFPRPFEVFHILGDLPHAKFTNEKAKRLLGWQPRDRLAAHWQRDLE